MKIRVVLTLLSLSLSVLIGLTLSRQGKEAPAATKKPLIGLSMDTLKEARWQTDRDVFVKTATQLGAEVLVQSANSDDIRQLQDVQALLSRKVDVLVVIPHNGAAMAKAVTLAHEAGIPVIAYDRIIQNSKPDLYITFDNVRVGEIQAQYLVDHLPTPGQGRIVRIYGAKTDNNALLLKQGQDNVLNPLIESGAVVVVHEDWAANWDPQNAKKIMNAAITAQGVNIDGILVSNDGTAGGVIQALKEEGLAGEILVTGQDADLVACQRIASGLQAMTVYKPVKALASRAAELAVKLAEGQPIIARDSVNNGEFDIPTVLLDVTPVSKANLDATVIADGFHQREDIYSDN